MELNRTNTAKADRLAAYPSGTYAISLGGLLTVTNIGSALQAGDAFTLFSGAFSGNFSLVTLPVLTPGLAWNTNALYSAGTLSVVTVPIPSFAAPVLSNATWSSAAPAGLRMGITTS